MPTKAAKKPTLVDEATGLPIVGEGKELRLEIKTPKDVEKALSAYATVEHELQALARRAAPKNALREMIRSGLLNYQDENEIEEVKHKGWKSILIERTKSMWIFTNSDLPEYIDISEMKVKPRGLSEIIEEKFADKPKKMKRILNLVSKRVIDPVALDAAVKEGLLSPNDIAPAYVEFTDTSYVKISEVKN